MAVKMKKIILLAFVLLLIPISFACGDEGHDNAITGDNVADSYDMDSGGMMGGNMMGSGMMSGYGMMGSWGFGFFSIIYTILLIGITILVYIWIVKLLKSMGGKK